MYKEYDGYYLKHYAQWLFWFYFVMGFFLFTSVLVGKLTISETEVLCKECL